MAIINGCDESKVWLHVERLNDKVRIVDQDGRVVGGCINLLLDVSVENITRATITVECASRDKDGKIKLNVRG
nr:MAG: hypothetical protein [Bacteriophage sp.]